jgi:hypothetical protein
VVSGAIGAFGLEATPASTSASGTMHSFRDRSPLDLCSCHHKAHDVSTLGLRLLHGANDITVVYVPSTTVASGAVVSAPCATVSA